MCCIINCISIIVIFIIIIGFVDLNIDEDSTILFIKNFNKGEKSVKVKVGKEEKRQSKKRQEAGK